MTKAEAKRQIDRIIAMYPKPWDVIPAADQAELSRLTKIAYPTGIPLPTLAGAK